MINLKLLQDQTVLVFALTNNSKCPHIGPLAIFLASNRFGSHPTNRTDCVICLINKTNFLKALVTNEETTSKEKFNILCLRLSLVEHETFQNPKQKRQSIQHNEFMSFVNFNLFHMFNKMR